MQIKTKVRAMTETKRMQQALIDSDWHTLHILAVAMKNLAELHLNDSPVKKGHGSLHDYSKSHPTK